MPLTGQFLFSHYVIRSVLVKLPETPKFPRTKISPIASKVISA